MPIKKEIKITKGWKAADNERYGPVVVILFKDTETGRTLFQYAPKHNEKEWFVNFFDNLFAYDMQIKKMMDLGLQGANGDIATDLVNKQRCCE